MKHYFSGKVRGVLLAAVILAVALAILSGVTGMSPGNLFVKGVLTPVRTGVSKLADQAGQLYDYMFQFESLAAENDQLKKELSELQDAVREADAIARENERLRELLGLKEDHEDYSLVDGYIISWSSNDWSNTFTINKGSNAGISVGMCTITASGEVAGLVTEVGTNYAVIKTVLDSTLEISATIASSGYNGTVRGGYVYNNQTLLRMNYLLSSAVIRNNDQVVTAGSTVYPRNLILGYVVDAGFNDTGVAKYAVLKPAVDISSLEQVFIITEYNAG